MDVRLSRIHLAIVPVRVSTVEKPTITRPYSNGTVTTCVATKGHKHNHRLANPNGQGGVEAQPLKALGSMRPPLGPMRPMFRPIGTPLKQRPGAEECIDLTLRGVDGCLGKVRQTTGMIHVKMGQEDVLHISRVVPQSGNLPNSRLVRIKGAVHNACELANRGCRLCAIAHPPACVNKEEPVVGRDQQAMNDAVAAHERPA